MRSTADSSWAEEIAHTAVDDRLGSLPPSTPPQEAASLLADAVRGGVTAPSAAEVEPGVQLPAPLIRPGQAKHVATAVVAAAAAK